MFPSDLILLAIFAGCVTLIIYLLISARHKERLALLEYERDISAFKGPQMLRLGGALKIGLFLLFGGVGLLLGFLLHDVLGIPEEVAVFSFLFIAAGAGLLTYYFIAYRINREAAEQ